MLLLCPSFINLGMPISPPRAKGEERKCYTRYDEGISVHLHAAATTFYGDDVRVEQSPPTANAATSNRVPCATAAATRNRSPVTTTTSELQTTEKCPQDEVFRWCGGGIQCGPGRIYRNRAPWENIAVIGKIVNARRGRRRSARWRI